MCSDTELESDTGNRLRQKNKPLMEKKRRARINRSLSQLKQILIQDKHQNSSQHAKWEKADILEMTVEYLQSLRPKSKPTVLPTVPTVPPPPTVTQFPPPQMLQNLMAYQQWAQMSMYSNFMTQFSLTNNLGQKVEKEEK